MTPIEDRLAATVRCGVIHSGDDQERLIAHKQAAEAVAEIRDLRKQNKLMKEKLVEERATSVLEGQPFCIVASTDEDVLGEEDSCEHEGNCTLTQCPNRDWYLKKAREQLQIEMPEADW